MEVHNDKSAPPVGTPHQPVSTSYAIYNFTKDTIVTYGPPIGWGIVSCVSFFFRKGISLISYFFQSKVAIPAYTREQLEDPTTLTQLFKADPYSVTLKILDLIENHPDQAQEVLVSIARFAKNKPEGYSPHTVKNDARRLTLLRRNWICSVDELVLKMLLPPDQLAIEEKVLLVEYNEQEASCINCTAEEWKGLETSYQGQAKLLRERGELDQAFLYEYALKFRIKYQRVLQIKKTFADDFWIILLEKINIDGEFNDLSVGSNSPTINPLPEEKVTLGNFMERLLFYRRGVAHNLCERETFDRWADCLRGLLGEVSGRGYFMAEISRIKILITKLEGIINDPKKCENLFKIVSEVGKLYKPSGKGFF